MARIVFRESPSSEARRATTSLPGVGLQLPGGHSDLEGLSVLEARGFPFRSRIVPRGAANLQGLLVLVLGRSPANRIPGGSGRRPTGAR